MLKIDLSNIFKPDTYNSAFQMYHHQISIDCEEMQY